MLLLASAAAAQAQQTINVTRTDDPTGAGDCTTADSSCSLRQAVAAASTGDTIDLPSGTYDLTQGTDIDITQSITLEGTGVDSTSIDGSQNSGSNEYGELARILKVQGTTVTIEDLTMTGGVDDEDENLCGGCSEIRENGGGALFNDGGAVTLTDVAFLDDPGGAAPGAAIGNNGTLNMSDVTFTGDGPQTLFTHGGAITGNEVTFQDDADGCCDYDGGAAYLDGGTVTLTNTTVVGSGGSASIGGGIDNAAATLTLTNDTLSGNTRGSLQTDPGGTTYVQNTIIGAGNSDGGDGDCVASGRPDDINGENSSTAITHDLGDNIDQDGSCDLTGATDFPNQDPDLAPIFDNGGGVQTEALLSGSPALGDPASSGCPALDGRGTARPNNGHCDIGAFEAVLHGAPTASTVGSSSVTDTTALLESTINLDGEAGGFHFVYGTSPGELTQSTPEAAAGVVSMNGPESETVTGLNPGTTYYYDATADNATASTLASNVEQFTTQADAPSISNVSVDSVTDTTATIDFTVNPEGSDTHYWVEYGPDESYGQQTNPVDIGSAPGDQNLQVNLSDLTPGSLYHFDVFASNGVQQNVDSGDNTFSTDQQVTGVSGTQVTVTDSGTSYSCPQAGDIEINWGDGSDPDTNAQVTQCNSTGADQYDYEISDTHTYQSPGHYEIDINYEDFGTETTEYALVSASGCGAPPADAYAQTVLSDSPLVYYPLDEQSGTTMCDASGNGNDGTYASSGVGYGVSGPLASDSSETAVSGDGSASDLLGAGPGLSGLSGNQSFTLEGWFRATTTTNEIVVALSGGSIAGMAVWSSHTSCGQGSNPNGSALALDEHGTSNCWDSTSDGVNLFDGDWHYLAIVYDSSSDTMTGYVDGASLGSETAALSSFGWSSPTVLPGGWVDNQVNQPFVGDAAEIAVYGTALSTARIDAHYQAASPPPAAPTVTGVEPNTGSTAGGASVTITGTHFTSDSTVKFGANAATNVDVISASQITATVPAGSAGTVDVQVTTPGGTSGHERRGPVHLHHATPSSPPPASRAASPPVVSGGSPTTETISGAAVSGTVNPESLATTAFFQYGLDPSDRGPGASTTLYDQTTPVQQVGADSAGHTVSASLTGLVPGALYHVRLVANNSDGTTFGTDQTFTTPQAPPPAPPVLGKTQNAAPVTGTVFIKTPSGAFVLLTGAEQIPSGAEIDALHGSLKITTATAKKGKTQQGVFGGAVFTLAQTRGGASKGLATLSLVEGAFSGAPSFALCKPHKALDATAASSKTLQLLHASAHGKFRTKGRYSAATVLGTKWTIADRCDGTLVHDITDSVAVTDFVRHKTIIIHAGQSYLAKATKG